MRPAQKNKHSGWDQLANFRVEQQQIRERHAQRLQASEQRRQAEAEKIERLRAERDAIDISGRVMTAKQLQQTRADIRMRIGVANPAGVLWL